jgi:hypothetical protein
VFSLPETCFSAGGPFFLPEAWNEKSPLHLEIHLNYLPQRKKFLAQ